MILEEDLKRYLEINRQLEKTANRIIDMYSDYEISVKYEAEDGISFLRFAGVSEQLISYEGDETWGYGGHEHYTLSLPIRLLLLNEDSVMRYIKFRHYIKKRRIESLKEQERKKQEAIDLKTYERLKIKFGAK